MKKSVLMLVLALSASTAHAQGREIDNGGGRGEAYDFATKHGGRFDTGGYICKIKKSYVKLETILKHPDAYGYSLEDLNGFTVQDLAELLDCGVFN